MSDISLSERASFGNISSQNHTGTHPKFQPVRVKALLDFYESDDEESEGRTQESDLESDPEDLGTLPQNDSGENVFDTSFKCVKSPDINSKVTIRRTSGKEEEAIDGSSKPECKEEPTVSSTNSNVPPSTYPKRNCLDTYSDGKEHNREGHDKISNPCTAIKIGSSCRDIVIENNGLIQAHEHKAFKSEKIISSELSKDHQPSYETMRERVCHEEPSKIEAGRHVLSVVNEEENPNKNPSSIISGNHPNAHNINSKYEMYRKGSSSSDEQSHEHLTTDTPLKHAHMNTARPIPCHSRRNIIINTPQNKMSSDLAKNHMQTPATMVSHSSQSIIGRTPLQPRNMSTMDSLQTPKTVIYGPNAPMHDTPRYFSRESRSARKPLADASPFVQNDVLAYPLDSKARLLQGPQLPRLEPALQSQSKVCFNNQVFPRSNTAKRALDVSEKPSLPLNHQRNEVLKENWPSNLEDLERKDRVIEAKATEIKPPNLNICTETKQSCCQMQEIGIKGSNPSVQEPQAPIAVSNTQSKQQEPKQTGNKVSNVQFTVPSTISKTKPSQIITVKGREYVILGTLGKGMSGEVLRVQDLSSFELCAIKCVNLSQMDKDSVQGCIEEITMLHKLQAPCIVKIFDHETKYPMVYVVMEMGDTDLSHLLKSMSLEKHLPLTMILYYWTEMLVAVNHIHNNGVIHSDLKPANFLLVRGRLKLIDFGIASSMNADMTSVVKNCPIGTLNYISPEALMDIGGNSDSPNHNLKYKISFKSDVWSLGCILYGLVYGRTPFQHIRQQFAKVNAITNPKANISFPPVLPSSASTQNPVYVPPILIDVMRKCLQHDPKARPTVAQLLQIQYIPIKPDVRLAAPPPNFPANMLLQAKQALNEEEWRRLTELLEKVRLS